MANKKMTKFDKRLMIGVLIFLFFVNMHLISMVSGYEVNYSITQSDSPALEISQVKYEPFPVNPGEYFDMWVKAEWNGVGTLPDVTFELLENYPFSLDPDENSTRHFGRINSEDLLLKYKIRVSEDAVEGINTLELRYNTGGVNNYWITKTFDIQIDDAQTDFDLVIQESTGTDVSLAIANIGKNTANSLIVRIPEQTGYKVSGTNGQMVGNLDSGDYTIVSFSLTQVSRASDAQPLQVQLDYTDSIGERRSLIKELSFISSSPIGSNFTGMPGRGMGLNAPQTSTSILSNIWFWIGLVVLVGIIYYFYRKRKSRTNDDRNHKGTPDWVSNERTKKK